MSPKKNFMEATFKDGSTAPINNIHTLAAVHQNLYSLIGDPEKHATVDAFLRAMMNNPITLSAMLPLFAGLKDRNNTEEAVASFCTTVAPDFWFGTLWAKYGFNVFRLSDSLCALLLLTDHGKLRDDYSFVYPFPAFVLDLPKGFLRMTQAGKPIDVARIHVTKFHIDRNEEPFYWFSAVSMTGISLWASMPEKELRQADVDLPPEKELGQVFYFDDKITNEDLWARKQMVKLTVNFLLWLGAKGGRETLGTPRVSERKKARAGGAWPTTWQVGGEVKLSQAMLAAGRESAKNPLHRAAGWELQHQHIVRGHSKEQPYGEGRKLHKTIFIKPYFRGPEGEEAWTKLYKASDL